MPDIETRVRNDMLGGPNPFEWKDVSTGELFAGKTVASADLGSKGVDMDTVMDFGAIFRQLAAEGQRQHHAVVGGVDVRLVRVEGHADGRWDRHDDTAETVVVWGGTFDVAFREHTVSLGAGQCCVVPIGADHQGTSSTGAEVILFKSLPAAA